MPKRQPPLPPVTDDHRRQALHIMGWRGWTLPMAQADPIRSRCLEALACTLRNRQAAIEHDSRHQAVRRMNPQTGRWCTQKVPAGLDAQKTIKELDQ